MITPVNIHLQHGGGQQRPARIVLHAMAEYLNIDKKTAAKYNREPGIFHAVQWLDAIKLSAHALITPTGGVIRCREDSEIAWHARGYNTSSLGVEFLVPGIHSYASFLDAMKTDWLPNAAFNPGVELVQSWLDRYEIFEIVTHAELDPDRKYDPGAGFPLNQFTGALKL